MRNSENWRVHVPSKGATTTQLQLTRAMEQCWSTAVRVSDRIKEAKARDPGHKK